MTTCGAPSGIAPLPAPAGGQLTGCMSSFEGMTLTGACLGSGWYRSLYIMIAGESGLCSGYRSPNIIYEQNWDAVVDVFNRCSDAK